MNLDAECSIEGCRRTAHARTWCITHYQRWRNTGTTADPTRPSTLDRFTAKMLVTTEGGCWFWTGSLTPGGYGQFFAGGRLVAAHRWAYEYVVGPIPEGLQLDHLCRSRDCVNPRHLEPVTQRENVLRGTGASARAARKAHCPSGHPYDGENTYVTPQGSRQCRTCKVARRKAA